MSQSHLIVLEAAKPTGAKVQMNRAERLSDGKSKNPGIYRANRTMRQSELAGIVNRQREGRSTFSAEGKNLGHKSNRSLAVVRSYKEPLSMAAFEMEV